MTRAAKVKERPTMRWELSGRQWIANVGQFTVSVRILGSAAKGTRRFIVGDVFGHSFLGSHEWHDYAEDAMLEVERIVEREARNFMAALSFFARPSPTPTKEK